MRTCYICHVEKPLTDFSRDKSCAKGRQHRCRPCDNEKRKAYVDADPERGALQMLHRNRTRHYGLSKEEQIAMFDDQGGLCKICGCELLPGRETHLDHDHADGRVRGFLCKTCNISLEHYEQGRGHNFVARVGVAPIEAYLAGKTLSYS